MLKVKNDYNWLPIETAPKEPLHPVLLYGRAGYNLSQNAPKPDLHVAIGNRSLELYPKPSHAGKWYVNGYQMEPTHWMPLPTPPKD